MDTAELLPTTPQGRFHVSIVAPVLVSFFALALHAVHLPFFGASPSNLSFIATSKVIFALQFALGVAVFTLVVTGHAPLGQDEILLELQAGQKDLNGRLDHLANVMAQGFAMLGAVVNATAPR